eukprot:g19505.t1
MRVRCAEGNVVVRMGGLSEVPKGVAKPWSHARRVLEKQGLVLLRGLLPKDAVACARTRLLTELKQLKAVGAGAELSPECAEGEVPMPSLLRRLDLQALPEVQAVLEHAALFDATARLLQTDEVVTTCYKWLRAVPPKAFTGPHMDRAYVGAGPRLTAWIPLGDVRCGQEELGALCWGHFWEARGPGQRAGDFFTTLRKLRHDAEMFTYLEQEGKVTAEVKKLFRGVFHSAKKQHEDPDKVFELAKDLHFPSTKQDSFVATGRAVSDKFLTDKTLRQLKRFLQASTFYFYPRKGAHLLALLEDGLASPILAQVALPGLLPTHLPLQGLRVWKADNSALPRPPADGPELEPGGAVNLLLWLVPSSALHGSAADALQLFNATDAAERGPVAAPVASIRYAANRAVFWREDLRAVCPERACQSQSFDERLRGSELPDSRRARSGGDLAHLASAAASMYVGKVIPVAKSTPYLPQRMLNVSDASDNLDDSTSKTPSTSKRVPMDISELVKQFEDLMHESRNRCRFGWGLSCFIQTGPLQKRAINLLKVFSRSIVLQFPRAYSLEESMKPPGVRGWLRPCNLCLEDVGQWTQICLIHVSAFCKYDNLEKDVQLILSQGGNINARAFFEVSLPYQDRDEPTAVSCSVQPLHLAVHAGNLRGVEVLLRQKAALESRSTFDAVPDFTPLHLATALWARMGEESLKQHEVVKLLLSHTADPHAVDLSGASCNDLRPGGHKTRPAPSLKRGMVVTVDVDLAKNPHGVSSSGYRLFSYFCHLHAAQLDGTGSGDVASGASPKSFSKSRTTTVNFEDEDLSGSLPLQDFKRSRFVTIGSPEHADSQEVLDLESEICPEMPMEEESAATFDRIPCWTPLADALLATVDFGTRRAAVAAARREKDCVVTYLLNERANPDGCGGSGGLSCLHLAVGKNCDSEIVSMLVENSADVTLKTSTYVRATRAHGNRGDRDVCIKVLLVANILDVRVMMALTSVGWSEIFAEKVVQAILSAGYEQFCFRPISAALIQETILFAAFLSWSFGCEFWIFPQTKKIAWAVIFAIFINESITITWWLRGAESVVGGGRWMPQPSGPFAAAIASPSPMPSAASAQAATEGDLDRLCDRVCEAVHAALLKEDPEAFAQLDACVKPGMVMLLGEVASKASVQYEQVIREAVKAVGYDDREEKGLDWSSTSVIVAVEERDLSAWSAVSTAESAVTTVEAFACDETPELRPLTEQLAQRMCQQIDLLRKDGTLSWLHPDAQVQVTVLNETDNDGSVAPQRLEAIAIVYGVLDAAGATSSEVEKELFEKVVKVAVPEQFLGSHVEYLFTRRATRGLARASGASGRDRQRLGGLGAKGARWAALSLVKAQLCRHLITWESLRGDEE